jgi:F420-dependent oxidoreductase-like protein
MTHVRLGIQTAQQNVEYPVLLRLWRFLDRETRFSSLFLMDHLVPPGGENDPDEPCLESGTLLGAAAQATDRIKLGCLVTANTFRHPALLAKMAATLDHVSRGRLILALGAGWNEFEHAAYGIALPALRERMDRFEEAVRILRLFLDSGPGERVAFEGEHYRLREAPFAPGFVQERPPLMIGGGGEKRTLRIAARYADVVNIPSLLGELGRKLEVLRAHCDAVGRDQGAIEKTAHFPLVMSEDPATVEAVRGVVARHLGLPVETIRREAPIGSRHFVQDLVGRYGELGVSEIVLPVIHPYDLDALGRLSEAFA